MTALGRQLADYSESDFGPLLDATPVGPTAFVVRTFPLSADLARLLDPSTL